jgi:LmbE family N-acetylglucosaminyl deacetylase
MNPYLHFTREMAQLVKAARGLPLGMSEPGARQPKPADAPVALFFSPHPDDECISGGVALRLATETPMKVMNVAVTQGSNRQRQTERFRELQGACAHIGFDLVATGPGGLERVSLKTREQDRPHWSAAVEIIRGILAKYQPRVVMCPHNADWNSTHIGTHYLVLDSLAAMPPGFECFVIETEFWGAMNDPNLMLEFSPEDVAEMIAALTFHKGELVRNPYHLSLPAWMMDNVRRGGELVGGQGGAAPDFVYAALYRFRKWTGGKLVRFYEGGKQLARTSNVGGLFQPEPVRHKGL